MTLVLLGGFVALVLLLAWVSRTHGERVNGCCAPADPRDDLRMRAAFDDEPPGPAGGSPGDSTPLAGLPPSYLLILVCPLMRLVMMAMMPGMHGGRDQSDLSKTDRTDERTR